MACCKAKICHADIIVSDNRHVVDFAPVIAVARMKVVYKAAVHFIDNHINSRKKRLEHIHRPFFKSFRHNCVVCICKHAADNIPCLIPAHALIVHKNAHQLGNCNRRMSVIDMNCNVIGQPVKIHALMMALEARYYPLNRARHEEILLTEAKRLTLAVIILGIKNLAENLRKRLFFNCLEVISVGKARHVKILFRACGPKPERVYDFCVISDYRNIIGNTYNIRCIAVAYLHSAVGHLGINLAAEANRYLLLRACNLPHAAVLKPVIGRFNLLAVNDELLEQAVFISD